MPSNDEVVFGIPNMQCPSCGCTFDISKGRIDKFSKAQRKRMYQGENTYSTTGSIRQPDREDLPSEAPEKNFIVLSCGNMHCDQYNKFKVLKIPRIQAPSVKVDLSD